MESRSVARLGWVLVVGFICSCSNDPAPQPDTRKAPWQAHAPGVTYPSVGAGGEAVLPAVAASRRRSGTFASAPDLGSLVRYAAAPVVRRSGAYTWHAAELSETHALRSIATGKLAFTAPDGTPITLDYVRHVEHPDGNWSWFGRGAGEQLESTVITFGPTAAFGTVPQGEGKLPLRLTVEGDRAWVVATDPALLDEEGAPAAVPDYLVPPKRNGGGSDDGMRMMSAAPVAATAEGANVVDVLVGYTPGFVESRGGTEAAVTRIHNLVDITNQAFGNSGINAEVRLVHTMQVEYADDTNNSELLRAMTSNWWSVSPPELSVLHQARSEYGADLVVLVRPLRLPEQESCGNGWLIGYGGRPITWDDQDRGFSVVSDGQDTDAEGAVRYCREETFAHELGHNMGSHHDRENAKDDDGVQEYGAYSYSFGKNAPISGGNFATVMAYGKKGQTFYRAFSNPAISYCGGFPCGTSTRGEQASNALSLNQTIPVIASFRDAVQAPPPPAPLGRATHDFDGDGRSDILWRNFSTGAHTIWPSGSTDGEQSLLSVELRAATAGVGDFDGDGHSQIVFHSTWGHLYIGDSVVNNRQPMYFAYEPNRDWRIVGTGDFDGDGRSDILWRHATGGFNRIWRVLLAGQEPPEVQALTPVLDPAWIVAGIGDFDGDGRSDILWRNTSTGANAIWPAASSADEQAVVRVRSQAWTVAGVGDFDGDGRSDILWRNGDTGANTIWPAAGTANEQAVIRVPNLSWAIAAVGDYNGDGRSDILWRNSATGRNTIWRSAGIVDEQAVATVPGPAWRIIGD